MEKVATYSFSLNTNVLKVVGLYPADDKKFLYKVYSYVVYVSAMFPITSLSALHFLLNEELTSFNYNDFMMVAMIFYTLKFLPFVTNLERMRRCIHYFDDPFFNVVTDKHKKTILDCVNICRRNSKIFFVGYLVGYTGFVGQAILNHRQLPLNVWMPKWVKNKAVYYYTEFILVLLGK